MAQSNRNDSEEVLAYVALGVLVVAIAFALSATFGG